MISSTIDRRRAGCLLHLSSLPGSCCSGGLGREAFRFVDFLQQAGLSLWQVLPVGPTGPEGSPYQAISAHAGNPRFIDLEALLDRGWIKALPLEEDQISDEGRRFAISLSFEGFKESATEEERQALAAFKARHAYWLDDYTLFQAIHDELCRGWWDWPAGLRDRSPHALSEARARLQDQIDYLAYEQYLFFTQWQGLRAYAHQRGVRLFGDMPIFVALDSAEVWGRRKEFDLNPDGTPRVVAGVPPDYFSEFGQRWGNPLYLWERMAADGFSFWVDRMRTQFELFDLIRVDHFRGFESYWEIPAEEETAVNGQWVKAPGDALFQRLHEEFGDLPLVAEDLGIITPEVEALRRRHGLPGMKVLQFAFSGGSDNPYLPFRHEPNAVVYTGTHDNDTTLGWYLALEDHERAFVDDYLGRSREPMPWPLIRAALGSCAGLAILPMQDLLGLDGSHRMNLPGTTEGNWAWRFSWDQVAEDLAERIRRRVEMYGRLVSEDSV